MFDMLNQILKIKSVCLKCFCVSGQCCRLSIVTTDVWFGLCKTTLNSATYFLDGNPSDFRNWGLEQPGNDAYCSRIINPSGYYWGTDCSAAFPVLCKIPTGKFQTSLANQDIYICFENSHL